MGKLILASGSPRRQELLRRMGLTDFVVAPADVAEWYPEGLTPEEIVAYISREKNDAIDAAADDVLAQLEAGADWDTLMAEKNQDPGMQSGVTAERGYAVSADMTSFDAAFVQAAMALEKIGDVSGKIRGDAYGYYIIKYVADAQEGDIALDEVKDTIESSLLSTKQNDTYTSAQKSWVDAADFKLDLNALKN